MTAETIDADGWLATGNVRIVDSTKNSSSTGSGKNTSPNNIGNALKTPSSLIGQVVAIGDAKPLVSALVVVDPDTAPPARRY
ncbi:hypothetical protein EF294_08475 [Gordonia oryzae]|uniref:AMP-dependent synthetase/ligase domain-containing protein n=1 Tax=Gordonia oryzae TaxID=2487349 RepID=A0A3N4GQS2_9ACTN|nr:hypothetical protein [Gordonia oryzae]RPA63518.1 hypothetical protein EF294_08475 [Gordonia oryzae]